MHYNILMDIDTAIKDASFATPDVERSLRNLQRLSEASPSFINSHLHEIGIISRLFAYSQFLADYCIRKPDILHAELLDINKTINKREILLTLQNGYTSRPEIIKLLRDIKRKYLLKITLRYIAGITNIIESMSELSLLAEAILQIAVNFSYTLMCEKFGAMENNPFSVIALGKLGAEELNYSSDIDIITVYKSDEGLSTGTLTPSGVFVNKINPHEYFSKLTELMTSILSSQTEDGIAYRVDLRLRPNGQKGPISLSLDSYSSYYESWGKTWERMALIRARAVAGDYDLGNMFINAIEPFVWKRSIDFHDIKDIRELKKKIDSITDVNDIKRGYGGIREIEFFVHTLQLLYGGAKNNIRTGNLLKALQELLKEGLLAEEDFDVLYKNYLFLRNLEHILQMKDDRQTHSLPQADEIEILAKKMLFHNSSEFISALKLGRLKIREMYNSLLGETEVQHEMAVFFEEELTDSAICDYLTFKGFKNADIALKNFRSIKDQISFGKTIREGAILKQTVLIFLDWILKVENKDRALTALAAFTEKIGGKESYTDLLSKRPDTIEAIVNAFSESTYITRSLLSLENLEGIFEYPDIRLDYISVKERLLNVLRGSPKPMNAIRENKIIEELKACLLFLGKFIDVERFSNILTMLADTILRTILENLHKDRGFAVIGLGSLGAKELTIGSDLDLLFLSEKEDSIRIAEDLIGFLSAYTDKGIAYKVDMGLRPDGSKGILVNDLIGYRNYYLKHAQIWEIQALLRARPIAGDKDLLRSFYQLKRQIIIQRGKEIRGTNIIEMRKRIVKEIAKDAAGFDIKHGYGGIGEIEFLVQYLQLRHASQYPILITYNTQRAIKMLSKYRILSPETEQIFHKSLIFFRTIQTLLRLNDSDILKPDQEIMNAIVRFLNLKSKDALMSQIDNIKQKIIEIANGFYK